MFFAISITPAVATTTNAATQDILDFYAAEYINCIDEMPASLLNEYQDFMELAGQYLLKI